ncbi:MAG: cation diffusion facilitator family transporter [Myxococcota bacterium]|nr:cation diffusion facilitator family transporter [Myxococcota bacterium]
MASGSTKAVYSAIAANTVVTIAKFAAFFVTGSGAMLSEGIHSAADVGNQSLLALGIARSKKAPDDEHPYGYTKEQFLWALISAVGIFFLGCGVTVVHGIHTIQDALAGHAHEQESLLVAWIVLVLAFVVEGWSLIVAVIEVRKAAQKAQMTLGGYLMRGPDPMGVAVVFEDSAAVFGVLLAAAAMGMSAWTHNAVWDGAGSIAIGLLMGALAIFLIQKNRNFLIGQSVDPKVKENLENILNSDPVIEEVDELRATVTGAASAELRAQIDFDGRVLAQRALVGEDLKATLKTLDSPAALQVYLHEFGERVAQQLAVEVDRIESRLEKEVPGMRQVDLEAE